MASSLTSILSIFLLLTPALSLTYQPDCNRPSAFPLPSSYISNVQSTLSQIQNIVSTIQRFTGFIQDIRLSSAISDCLDLLDLSSTELSFTVSSTKPIPGTRDHRSDLLTYLSAALSNQDTCKESLQGTNSILASLIGSGLDSVTSLISNGLHEVGRSSNVPKSGATKRKLYTRAGFPKWVEGGTRRLLQSSGSVAVNVTVAKDGSGNYTTVGEAVEAAPGESGSRFVIYVKKGVYVENVEIKKKKWNIMVIGDGMDVTVVSGSRNFIDGWTTYRSATFAVSGKGFIARDLTFENTAGPSKHQAVAFRSDSDLSAYYRCAFRGYQDTLYAHSLRQFYRDCIITGTVDYIFGNAAAVFQNTKILSRLPLPDQKVTVTAQGRKDPNQNTGFTLQFCNITADADLVGAVNKTYSYLGRPWKEYSRTVVMQSYLGSAIRPEGWLAWQGDFALSTLYYAEYMNYGPSSGLTNRVNWTGYHQLTNQAYASNFTVANFIDGNLWLPSTGVKYTAGFTA